MGKDKTLDISYTEAYKAWIDEIMEIYFTILKITFIYPTAFATILRNLINLYSLCTSGISDKDLYIPILTMLITTVIIIGEKQLQRYRTEIFVLFIEYLNLICFIHYITGVTSSIKVYTLISSFLTFKIQFFMFKMNVWILLLLQFKTIAAWTLIDVNTLSFTKAINFGSLIGLTTIMLYLVFWVKIRERILIVIFKYKQQIFKNEMNLKNIVETLPDGLAVLNLNMKVKLYNKPLKDILRIPSKQDFLDIFQRLQYIDGSRCYTEGSESHIYKDVLNYCESNNRQPANFGITQIHSKFYQWKGNISTWNNSPSLILLVRDCTAIIDLEKAKAMQIYQTAVLRSISHELKTPTSAIITANEQLMEELQALPEYRDKLNVINSSGSLLLNLINSLLDYVLINSNTFVLNKSRQSLKQILEEVISTFSVQARQKKVRLLTQLNSDIPLYIYNDGQRLKQVIINILSNAIKYTQRGCITIRMKIQEDKLKVYIKDTGIGIPQNVLCKLFHLFGSQNDLSSNTHGCGLKLHISNLLVEKLGGDHIFVKSTEGVGTCFLFYIDTGLEVIERVRTSDSTLENIPFISIPDSYSIPSFPSEIPLILIVDDNEFNRYVIGEFLKKDKIVFDEAINGLEAVRMIKERNRRSSGYRVVIMDCQMPVMDGWEATKRVVEMMREGMIKLLPAIIGYTAYSGSDEEMKSRDAGMIDFIEKPCPRDKLMGTIKQYLE